MKDYYEVRAYEDDMLTDPVVLQGLKRFDFMDVCQATHDYLTANPGKYRYYSIVAMYHLDDGRVLPSVVYHYDDWS